MLSRHLELQLDAAGCTAGPVGLLSCNRARCFRAACARRLSGTGASTRAPQGASSVLAPSTASHTVRCQAVAAPVASDAGEAAIAAPRVLIAGAGIGGLVLALGLLKRGFNVQLFERDLTAIRGEGKYRGPIQVQSNALATLEALDYEAAQEIMAEGCITGDRINGLCDGETGDWYVKFDTFHPATDRGLPVTRVISRVTLQRILADACIRLAGEDVILNDATVVDYEHRKDSNGKTRVWALLRDGRQFDGDVLIGADGIWSKVRNKMVGPTQAAYSQYTCYTGISDFTPADIDTVGYRVFLGNRQYFVSSDVGNGKMQWYAFHREPAGGKDEPGTEHERLLRIFGHWCDNVTDLIKATPADDILRRDIFDRPPIFKWADGRVALLGDSAHAMQPNLGQGGCMAIEDGYLLARELAGAVSEAAKAGREPAYERVLQGYFARRILRVSAIHGMAGMAAFMASTYKAYLGEGLGPLSFIRDLRIPHPGRVSGQLVMKLAMPGVLGWILGGSASTLAPEDRVPSCRLADKPRAFDEKDFPLFMEDDAALLRAAHAHWLLQATGGATSPPPLRLEAGRPVSLGRGADCDLVVEQAGVAPRHAVVEEKGGDYWLTDCSGGMGTWVNGRRVDDGGRRRLGPGDEIALGGDGHTGNGLLFKVKMRHVSLPADNIAFAGQHALKVAAVGSGMLVGAGKA